MRVNTQRMAGVMGLSYNEIQQSVPIARHLQWFALLWPHTSKGLNADAIQGMVADILFDIKCR